MYLINEQMINEDDFHERLDHVTKMGKEKKIRQNH